MKILFQQIIIGISIGSVYALIASGYALVYSLLDFSNWAHGEVCMLGAYCCFMATRIEKLPFAVSVVIGVGGAALISCLGFGECVRVLFNYTRNITGGANGYSNIPYRTTALVAFASAVLAFVIAWNFIHSKYGQNLSAIRENEVAAAANGIDVVRFKKMAFVFSALYAGWAGGLYAHYLRYITPALFNLSKSSELIITTVLGGLGSLTGSVLGTIIVQLLPEIFRSLAEYRMLFYGIAVVLVILVRPNGLYGYREFSLKRVVAFVTSRLGKGVKSHE